MPGVKGLGKLACEPAVVYVALNRPRDRQQWEHGDLHLTWILFLNQSVAAFHFLRYRSRGGPLRAAVQCICAERRKCIGRRALVAYWRRVDLRRKPVRARLSQVTGRAAELEPEILAG